MKYFILTYGCQMNHSDSERIATQLECSGHKPVKTVAKADLIVVNICSIRQSAVHRALDQIYKLSNKKIIVAGCVLPEDRKKLAAKNIDVWHPDDYFWEAPLRQNKFSAFVPIMTGCNNFCSYCAVPFTRGREKSRPAQEIIAEIKKLLKGGAEEIILLGQNVNSYKDNCMTSNPPAPPFTRGVNTDAPLTQRGVRGLRAAQPVIDFPSLLQLINSLPGNFRLSFISSHPKDMSDDLIETVAKCAKVSPYIHLPVQSGDNKILKAMNRHYSVAHYKNLIKKLRLAFKKYRPDFFTRRSLAVTARSFTQRRGEGGPPLAISTDIIVGFPGETARQFQNTLKLIKDVKFDMIYFARYSPRNGTVAARMSDNVSPIEKRRRAQAINSLLKKQASILNKKYINQKVDILIEKIDGNFAFGKTTTNKNVKISMLRHPNLVSGSIVAAKITSVTAWSLKGEM